MHESPPAPSWLDRAAYPFQSRYLSLSAGRMHYVDEGRGDPILFVHGTPTWSFEYRHLVRALSRQMRCVAPDHLGFGLSERPAGFSYAPEAHAAMLDQFVRQLDLTRITLVVHDFGGPIGLPLALNHPGRVARLVLLNTWMWPFDDDPEILQKGRIAGGAMGHWLYEHVNFSLRVLMPYAYGRRAALTPDIHRQYLEVFRDKSARGQVLHALARALVGSRDFYANLWDRAGHLAGRPALIVWGLKDPAFTPRLLARWQRLLPAATTVELAEAGHWPHEEQPDRVVAALRLFLGVPDGPQSD
jgi:haloalkane dehalogenase